MLSEKEVLHLLEETKAVLHGHFLLTSGLHSPMYVEKFNVLQHPEYTETLCREIAARYAGRTSCRLGPRRPEPCHHAGPGLCQRSDAYCRRSSDYESGRPPCRGGSYRPRNQGH